MLVKNLSMRAWRALMRWGADDRGHLPVVVTSSSPGHVDIRLRYWANIGGRFVQDEAVQRVTSVLPPLRLDITRDGSIDVADVAAGLGGRRFCY